MNDDLLSVILLVGVLALAARAMLSHRAPFRTVVGGILLWGVIGLALFVGFNNRDRIDNFFASITGNAEQRAEGGTVRIQKARDGHFWARVKLNGFERRMLIDSGATVIALSTETAEAAGIEPTKGRPPVLIETANGTVEAASANLQKLEIGPLTAEDLEVTISDNLGDTELLGMNFLSRLKSWRVEGNTLVLEPDGPETGIEAAEQPAIEPGAEPGRGGERKRPEIRLEKNPPADAE